ncbi:MAG: hypothetical protein ACLR2G_05385 [Phascolarctobacterium faecium]
MSELADYLLFLSNVGIDGIIVQDLVIRPARRTCLLRSTQMTVNNLRASLLLKPVVAPARAS